MKFKTFLASLLCVIGFTFFGSASLHAADLVQDDAGLFSDIQIATLTQQLEAAADKTKTTFMIATSSTITQNDTRTAVDRVLGDAIGNNNNGILFFIDMTGRQIYLSTSGNMIQYMSDARIDDELDAIFDNGMSSGDYYSAAQTYVSETLRYFEKGVPTSRAYKVDATTGAITYYKSITAMEGLIAVVVAAVVALIVFFTTKARYQLKKPDYHYAYQQDSTLDLTEQKDQLTNSFVTTRRIPKPTNNSGGGSSTHSSGGGSFGGGSRGF